MWERSVDSTKEKRSWFHSLTWRKKSDSALVALPTSSDAVASSSTQMQNNNNEVCVPNEGGSSGGDASMIIGSASSSSHSNGGTLRKRKDKRNVFSRLRRKVGQGLSSLRNWNSMGDSDCDGGTTDATFEFLTPSIFVEPTLPFTHDYLRFIQKKWLERLDTPNEVMYKACLEMLNQVWYWGEISRRDAQRRLSDKSTGSFGEVAKRQRPHFRFCPVPAKSIQSQMAKRRLHLCRPLPAAVAAQRQIPAVVRDPLQFRERLFCKKRSQAFAGQQYYYATFWQRTSGQKGCSRHSFVLLRKRHIACKAINIGTKHFYIHSFFKPAAPITGSTSPFFAKKPATSTITSGRTATTTTTPRVSAMTNLEVSERLEEMSSLRLASHLPLEPHRSPLAI